MGAFNLYKVKQVVGYAVQTHLRTESAQFTFSLVWLFIFKNKTILNA